MKKQKIYIVALSIIFSSVCSGLFLSSKNVNASEYSEAFAQSIKDQAAYIKKKCGAKPNSSNKEKYNAWTKCYVNYSYYVAQTCPSPAADATNKERIEHWKCNKKFYNNDKSKWDADAGAIVKPNGDTYQSNPDGDTSGGGENSCGGVATSILSCESPSGTSDDKGGAIWGILLLILNILTAGVGIVAIGGFVYGALIYTAAQDNASQVSKAKEIIFNVVLGLFLYALMYSFLQFIIPGGIFK